MSVTFEGGAVGHIHVSWLEPNKIREATVVGERKMLVYDDVAPEAKLRLFDKGIDRQSLSAEGDSHNSELGRYDDFSRFQLLTRAGDILIPKLDLREPLGQEIRHFAACIRGETTPLADGRAGRGVVAVLEAAQRSLENDGAPEEIKDPVNA